MPQNIRSAGKGRTAAMTDIMLREWAWCGRNVASMRHHKTVWKKVQADTDAGRLLAGPQVVSKFVGADGQAVMPLHMSRKRKQT